MLKKMVVMILAALWLTGIGLTSLMDPAAEALRKGDRGSEVSQVQTRLKDWDFYKGRVDGIFGSLTDAAVKAFQRKNGLYPDGIVGSRTAEKIGVSLPSLKTAKRTNPAKNNVYLLAQLVYGEARGEPYSGKVAVAAVVLNRVDSSKFPNSIAGVIYQPGAFSVVDDGQINLAPDAESLRAARDALNGYDPSGGSLYYYNPAKTTNRFMLSRPVMAVIGGHRFCR
jgi:N-acetylmuramoyl-L-alanine amidase